MHHQNNIEHPSAQQSRLQSFGRLRGHRLRGRQSGLLKTKLPELEIKLHAGREITPKELFANPAQPMWLEIGFGSGEHLVWQAIQNPHIGFIGAEPYINGVAKLLVAIECHQLSNVRIHHDDVRYLLDSLKPQSLARVFILFPDPWPKARHHKRRLINAATLASLARAMKPGSQLRIASDIADYQRWIMVHIHGCAKFEWQASSAEDWRYRPADWPPTRYEKKADEAGRKSAYLTFQRSAD